MHDFHFKHDELYCEEVAVQEIAGSVETPFYLYSRATVLNSFERIDKAFGALDHLICFAMKANSNHELLRLLASHGAGADVVSGGELQRALSSGFVPGKIVFAGVGKRDDEIRAALSARILALHVESLQELQVIDGLASEFGMKAPVAIRVNPDIDIEGHPYISTGKEANKFGIEISQVKALLPRMAEFVNVELIGLHCHVGSQISKIKPYAESLQILIELSAEMQSLGLPLQYVDIGGGLGVKYEHVFEDAEAGQANLTPESLVGALLPQFEKLGCKILFEPGRALVAEAGILVTRVLYVKEGRSKTFVIVDAGMNDFLRPSLYGAYHEIVPLRRSSQSPVKVDVVGPICESGDFFAKERRLPPVRRGDCLAIMTAGAYGYALASNYNGRPRPAEVLVDGDQYRIVCRREDTPS